MTARMRSVLLVCLLTAGLASAGAIDTVPLWNGTQFISSFGPPNTQTYGQVINVNPGAGTLNSFSFEIICVTGGPATFRGEVFAWDGTKATGSSLFESAPQTLAVSSSFALITFNTGGLALAPGLYVLFASSSQDTQTSTGCRWGSVGNVYTGGAFVFQNNGTNIASWTTTTWSTISGSDLAFQAVFSGNIIGAVPIPNTLLLLAVGLIAVGLFAWYRRRLALSRSGLS